jgi:hypothetical protein
VLNDLLLLETYFEGPETVQFYDDMIRQYGPESVDFACAMGFLIKRPVRCGPFCDKFMVWLSDTGRERAISMSSNTPPCARPINHTAVLETV